MTTWLLFPLTSSRRFARNQVSQDATYDRMNVNVPSDIRKQRMTSRMTVGQTRLAALKAKRRRDRYAGFKAVTALAAKQVRVVWGVGRSGTPYTPTRAAGLRRHPR